MNIEIFSKTKLQSEKQTIFESLRGVFSVLPIPQSALGSQNPEDEEQEGHTFKSNAAGTLNTGDSRDTQDTASFQLTGVHARSPPGSRHMRE